MASISALVLNRDRSLLQACVEQLTAVDEVRYRLTFEEDEAALFFRLDNKDVDCVLFGQMGSRESDRGLIRLIRKRHPLLPVVMVAPVTRAVPAPGKDKAHKDRASSLHATILNALGTKRYDRVAVPERGLPTILLIDNNPDDRAAILRTFAMIDDLDVVCLECGTMRKALKIIAERQIDCILLDYALPGWTGVEFLHLLKAVTDEPPVIMMIGPDGEATAMAAMQQGAHGYLVKTRISPASLRNAVGNALAQSGLRTVISQQRDKICDQQQDLSQTSRMNDAILAVAPCMIVATDADGMIRTFNPAAERITGYRASEMIGRSTLAALCDPDQLAERLSILGEEQGRPVESGFQAILHWAAHDRSLPAEWQLRRRDSTLCPVQMTITALDEQSADMPGYLAVISDVTRRKKSEIALHRSERQLRLSMHNAPSGIALVDLEMRWLEVNPALCNLLGYESRELHKAVLTDLIHSDEREKTRTDFRAILRGRSETVSKELRLLHKSGGEVSVIFSFSLIRSEDGAPMHFILQIMDISERKQMDRLKSEFISIVSHELRTPLTSINGSLGLLLNTQAESLPVFARELLIVANRNCERLMMLVNDILDIDRISSGQMHFDVKPEPMGQLIDQMVEANTAYAQRLGVKLVAENFDRSLKLKVDFLRLTQVLTNFVSNATKFSDPGDCVEIRSEIRGGRIRISVCDHGCGVPAEYEPRMFTRFAQADSSVARKKNGSGLGLYIAKQMTEHMGGEIGYHPTQGGGATFWVEVPLADAACGPPPAHNTNRALAH
ncbi:hybrid sensor histidine kinase/response regulator [Rhizobium halophytocola]|uniref:histidine kinase n=1 Tax=Rhizobium halophytocola TaxID=735519 RepID=A0ABS4E6I0_9HYPH|nr:PAS domain S-box protein [Rhizobium halophytocola]MBP1853550.1 PAS domain S-box-containing protein [Rhizobium halophytocola]